MKKISLIIAFAAISLSMFAGNPAKNMEAFKHLGISIEAGTMGAGINLSMPVVTEHLVFSVGYNLPTIKYSSDIDIEVGNINSSINQANSNIAKFKENGISNTLSPINNVYGSVTADAKLNLGNMKFMFEYYPSVNHTFHITAGVMVGKKEFIELEGHTSINDWNAYKAYNSNVDELNGLANLHPELGISPIKKEDISFEFDDAAYKVDDLDKDGTGDVKAALNINKIKPYLGIGFGRSIPNKRVGFQFEIGAWYHGSPALDIANPKSTAAGYGDDALGDIMDVVNKTCVYPQITFRLTGRLF